MGRSVASIQAQIDIFEGHLESANALLASANSDSTSIVYARIESIQSTLDKLHIQLGRANGTSPQLTRGVVTGFR